jgi:hypothetical protein
MIESLSPFFKDVGLDPPASTPVAVAAQKLVIALCAQDSLSRSEFNSTVGALSKADYVALFQQNVFSVHAVTHHVTFESRLARNYACSHNLGGAIKATHIVADDDARNPIPPRSFL